MASAVFNPIPMLPHVVHDSLHSNYHVAYLVHDSLLSISLSADMKGDSLHSNYHVADMVHDSLLTISQSSDLKGDSLLSIYALSGYANSVLL